MARNVYIDSCALIAYLKNEKDHADVVQAALTKARERGAATTLFTSSLTVVEVAYVNELSKKLEQNIATIDLFWRTAPIKIIEINRINADRGRDLLRDRARNAHNDPLPRARNRAMDAMHLATALAFPCDEFWTYDTSDFEKYQAAGIVICEPHVDQLGLPLTAIDTNQ